MKNKPYIHKIMKVAIYGAGAAGAQLYNALKISGKYDIAFFIDDSPNLWNREINNIPIKRIGEPDDISSLTKFLASDKASYITGQTFHVNGGMLM